jgi:hypothetical protein
LQLKRDKETNRKIDKQTYKQTDEQNGLYGFLIATQERQKNKMKQKLKCGRKRLKT